LAQREFTAAQPVNSMNSINPINSINTKYFLLTVDVEDWFQVENFKPWIPFSSWDYRELRVEKNVHQLLDLFDSVELNAHSSKLKAGEAESSKEHAPTNSANATNAINSINVPGAASNKQHTTDNKHTKKVSATFFVLGWLAEKLPGMVREIQARGHEVASHGYNHELPNSLVSQDLKNDLIGSKKLLEDIIGESVVGYRAPSFAITDDILQTISECGYQYDSSYNSFGLHGRYGKISLNGSGRKGIAHRINENFHELPISNLEFENPISYQLSAMSSGRKAKKRFVLPLGGGGYFRIIPHFPFKFGVKLILKKKNAYLFFMHPWEIDPKQPRIQEASANFKFRHYSNIFKTHDKLKNLIGAFSQCRFPTCSQYLSKFV